MSTHSVCFCGDGRNFVWRYPSYLELCFDLNFLLLFSGDYTVDFKPVNSGTYKFASVLKFTGVSVSFCAQFCIEQQGSACHGFYFCQQTMDCYLTSIQSQSGQPQVQVDTSTYSVLCNYYTSKYSYLSICRKTLTSEEDFRWGSGKTKC